MTRAHRRVPELVALSISESADLDVYGLGECHLREAMAECAIHMLSSGASLAYGGDLRKHGLTNLFFELVWRYRRRTDQKPRVVNYLAWPVHIGMEAEDLCSLHADVEDFAELAILREDGTRMTLEERIGLAGHKPRENEWEAGLTAMRKAVLADADALILIGGRVDGYKGRMPGIAEEALLSLESKQPTFLLGGFGGCTRDIAVDLGLVNGWANPHSAWQGREEFTRFSEQHLTNGLSLEENRQLASTSHGEEAVIFVLRGLYRLQWRKFQEELMLQHEVVDQRIEEDFTTAEGADIQADLEQKLDSLGLDSRLAAQVIQKSRSDTLGPAARPFNKIPARQWKEARRHFDEEVRRTAKVLLSRVGLTRHGVEIPHNLKTEIGALNNSVAAIMMVNQEIARRVGGGRKRSEWTDEEFVVAKNDLPEVLNYLVRQLKMALNSIGKSTGIDPSTPRDTL